MPTKGNKGAGKASGTLFFNLSNHLCRNAHGNGVGGDVLIDKTQSPNDGILTNRHAGCDDNMLSEPGGCGPFRGVGSCPAWKARKRFYRKQPWAKIGKMGRGRLTLAVWSGGRRIHRGLGSAMLMV